MSVNVSQYVQYKLKTTIHRHLHNTSLTNTPHCDYCISNQCSKSAGHCVHHLLLSVSIHRGHTSLWLLHLQSLWEVTALTQIPKLHLRGGQKSERKATNLTTASFDVRSFDGQNHHLHISVDMQ